MAGNNNLMFYILTNSIITNNLKIINGLTPNKGIYTAKILGVE